MPTYYHNEILFSEIYLEEITRQAENADVLASLKVLGEYREYANTHNLKAWKESYVHEVLSALGFFAQAKNDHLTHLFSMGSDGKENPLSLCYVILPEENLDNTTIGRNWAEKIIRALRENNLQWGLLTNGKHWRIYHQDEPTPYETYLEIDLEAILNENAKEAYQIFHKFMKAENFSVQEDGKCQFDRFKKESQDKIDYIEKELANALKQREEGGKGVLSDLCMGYVEELRRRNEGDLDDEDLRQKIYHGAMLYMFRLLFLFYADARGLLSDENHSILEKVEAECRTRHDGDPISESPLSIWDSLEQIFVDIDQTYNGGLFSPQESKFTRFLSDTRIGDTYLANVIFNLTTYREKNGQENPISYRDMSVRHLGTLYEGLLEHKLYIAKEDTEVKITKGMIQFIPLSQGGKLVLGHFLTAGAVYFAGDLRERKSTGSYYTPEYIVDYIVRSTVGEKLKELKTSFLIEEKANLDAFYHAVDESERTALLSLVEENALEFVRQKVLRLSVLDPAMGSGHFLVNATNLIANFITDLLNELGIEGTLSSGTAEWRRWIVENCIFGVDINLLAVELAKLSLWILSMAKDQPLSFLNHHLKCGNSLVGARLDDIGNYPFSTIQKQPRQLALFEHDPDFKAAVEEAVSKTRLIAAKGSTSLDDVKEKKAWLEEIEQTLEKYKIICDIHTNIYFGLEVDEVKYTKMIEKKEFDFARAINKTNQYFHWELEFPIIFLRNMGFDCVIGNPPWGANIDNIIKYIHIFYPDSTSNHTDSFKLFIDRAIQLSKNKGIYSMIVPNSIIRQKRSRDVRRIILNYCLNTFVDLGDNVFEGVVAPCCIFVGKKVKPEVSNISQSLNIGYLSNVVKGSAIWKKETYSGLHQSLMITNPDFEWADTVINSSSKIILLGEFTEYICKDSGINYQRVNIGMQEKGKSDLSSRLFYESNLALSDRDKEYWKGTDIDRYYIANHTNRYCRTNTKDYLQPNEVVQFNPRVYSFVPKILLRQTADRIIATVDEVGIWFGRSILSILPTTESNHSIYYLVALLNSKYFEFLYHKLVQEKGRVFAQVKLSKIKQLPVRLIDFENNDEIHDYEEIVTLSKKLHALKRMNSFRKNDCFDTSNDQSILDLLHKIDIIVYRLYGLSQSDINDVQNKIG